MKKDNLIGRTTTIETGYCKYRTGTHVREAEMVINLGNGISGSETYIVLTIVDEAGKEHIGQLRNTFINN